jgi:hypothetical protein
MLYGRACDWLTEVGCSWMRGDVTLTRSCMDESHNDVTGSREAWNETECNHHALQVGASRRLLICDSLHCRVRMVRFLSAWQGALRKGESA